MTACGCNRQTDELERQCPLCKEKSKNINFMAVKPVVKQDLQRFVQKDNYYICRNTNCDVVFFNEEENIVFLTRDIDMSADFSEVSKNNKHKCQKGCGGCSQKKGG
ncbi:hypothetical protein SAMN05660297_01867 [Natronincola peptidivorans]|uniref:CopZ zinc binding domain-containing protein n=1 Tax=Natronincola peptidivorans TaxID=426128 RepID=A0A1I0D713_9FIRM|nr:hypothetical protein [Natronincola peptidivorans]SET27300.1 hypothetical protein SAMN05660297_01867 [Natronincola peptidivorans]